MPHDAVLTSSRNHKWHRQTLPSPLTMPQSGLFDYGRKIQTEALPIFERISPVLLIVASNRLIKHRQPAIGRNLPRGAGIVFDQLILFSENLNQNASLGHFI